jgi:hypothetical protein
VRVVRSATAVPPVPQTKQELASDAGVEVMSCARAAVAEHLPDADVLVPLMCRIDEPLLLAAKRAKLIIQYGVGLEVPCPTGRLGPLRSARLCLLIQHSASPPSDVATR